MGKVLNNLLRFFFPPAYHSSASRTVRFAFPAVAFLSVLFVAAVSVSQQSEVELVVSDSTVREGVPFSVDVYVSAQVPVNAIDIEVAAKESVRVTGIDTGESVITLWTHEPYVEEQTVFLRGGTFRRGFVGRHLVATINAVSDSSGIAEFKVTSAVLLAGDGSGESVPVDKTDAMTLYVENSDGTFATSPVGVGGAVVTIVITDIDGDGEVSLADVSRFMVAWSSKSSIYDFDSDGRMTFRDFGIMLSDVFFK